MLIVAVTSLVLAAGAPGAAARDKAPQAHTPSGPVLDGRRGIEAEEERAPARPRVHVKVSSPQLRGRGAGHGFPAHAITDLRFDVHFPGRLRGAHVLELDLYTPRGYLYQVLKVPFTGAARGGARRLPGDPRLRAEQVMQQVAASEHRVSARLPVAGTWIVTNALYGSWRVEARLDGERTPSGHARFVVQP